MRENCHLSNEPSLFYMWASDESFASQEIKKGSHA